MFVLEWGILGDSFVDDEALVPEFLALFDLFNRGIVLRLFLEDREHQFYKFIYCHNL